MLPHVVTCCLHLQAKEDGIGRSLHNVGAYVSNYISVIISKMDKYIQKQIHNHLTNGSLEIIHTLETTAF
jgi:hypothetical protein